MAWLLRLVVVLVTWAAGSAENVIDMKVVVFYPLTLCAPYRLLHIASTVNADVLLYPAVLARSFIVWGGDFNSGFGLHQDGTRWDKGVGDANLKCPKPGSASWYDWLQVNDMAFVTTHCANVAASFFHHSGSSSLVEHDITPANVASNATARINWKVARVLQHIPSKEVRDHVPIFFSLHYNWYGSWKSFLVGREQWDYDKLAACLLHGTDRVPFLESLVCVRCFGFLDLSTRFCHMCGHPELEAVPDTFHGRETGAQKNVSCCEALRSQVEEAGNVFWGWARSTSAQIKAAASLESAGWLDLEGRAPPCWKPGEAPELLGGRVGVGLATFSRTELLEHRGAAVSNSDGAAPSKFVGSFIHTVVSSVRDPSIIRMMNWKLISNSKYVEKHFRHS